MDGSVQAGVGQGPAAPRAHVSSGPLGVGWGGGLRAAESQGVSPAELRLHRADALTWETVPGQPP